MNIKDFVTAALTQISEGAEAASNNNYKFYLDVDSSKGVHFDLAVINTEEKTGERGGKIGVNIKVVEAGIGSKGADSTTSESISHIQFNIKYRDLAFEREESGKKKIALYNKK